MKHVNVKIKMVAPLLMHHITPDALMGNVDKVTAKDKTAERENEWKKTIYEQDGIIGITAENIDAMMKAAAKLHMLGKLAPPCMFCVEDFIPGIYEGETHSVGDVESNNWIDTRVVRVQSSRIVRRRSFHPTNTEFNFTLLINDDVTIKKQSPVAVAEMLLNDGGMRVGLGDFRPRFGRFEVIEFD